MITHGSSSYPSSGDNTLLIPLLRCGVSFAPVGFAYGIKDRTVI